MLAMLDLGALCGAPLIGVTVDYSTSLGLPPYATTFVALALWRDRLRRISTPSPRDEDRRA